VFEAIDSCCSLTQQHSFIPRSSHIYIDMVRALEITLFLSFLLTVTSGFVVPDRDRPLLLRTKLFSQTEESDTTPTDCEPCNAIKAKSCDLGEQLKEDLEIGYARRQGAKVPQPTNLDNVTLSILNNTFVRFDTSQMRNFLLNRRSYARPGPFEKKNLGKPPVVEDLLPAPTLIQDSFYLSVPAAVLTFIVATVSFPVCAGYLVKFMETPPEKLDQITDKLVPGISVLYGTFISLTLSILYNRQREVQNSVSKETSMLSFVFHNMVSLFKRDRNRMVRAGQCAADQVRILLRESRGLEYMTIIYTDPYMRMLELIEEEEDRLVEEHGDFLSKGVSTGIL
jgi:hypothetical protein